MVNLSLKEAAAFLGVTPENIMFWVKKNLIVTLRPIEQKKEILFDKQELKTFIDKHSVDLLAFTRGAPKGYFSAAMLEERLQAKKTTIKSWFRKGLIKGAVIYQNPLNNLSVLIVPEQFVIEFESLLQNLENNFMSKEKAKEILCLSESTYQSWVKKGIISGIVDYLDLHYVPVKVVARLKEQMQMENDMLTLSDIEEEMRIPAKALKKLIPPSYLIQPSKGRTLLMSSENFKKFKSDYYSNNISFNDLEEFLTSAMLAERFNVPRNEINRWMRQGRFTGIKKFRNMYAAPKESVAAYEKQLETFSTNYFTIGQITEELDVSSGAINNWINEGRFPGAIKWLDKWYVPKDEVNYLKAEEQEYKINFITIVDACNELKISRKTLIKFEKEQLLTIVKRRGAHLISKADVERLKSETSITRKPKQKAKKIGNGKNVDIPTVKRPEGYLSTTEAALYIGGKLYNTISYYVKQGYFPNAIKSNKRYYIPRTDLDEYLRLKALGELPRKEKVKTKKVESKQQIVNQLFRKIKGIDVPVHLHQTKKDYLDYIKIRIASLNGRISTLKSEVSRALSTFENILLHLSCEAFELSDQEIENILKDTSLKMTNRILSNWFFQYAFRAHGINNRRTFVISQEYRTSKESKEIYSPEIYLQYLDYTKDVNLHTGDAIKSQYYANMWLYTIMHLIDTWRPSDVVNELLPLDTDSLNILDLDWFLKNQLSNAQAQQIINQMYLITRNSKTSKTNALMTFLVPMDFVLAAGTAFAICELHRKKRQETVLIQTLLSDGGKARSPNNQHLRFFKHNVLLRDFKSLVLIRSTMTYLFNSIVEDSPDPELALVYTQNARSHSDNSSSTAIYVQATNQDGTTGRVSVNLFNRGHFGWLYNTLISMMFQDSKGYHTLEERSMLIREMREHFTPTKAENWAVFLRRCTSKREPIIRKLSSLTSEEIRNLVGKIFSNEMPARTENGQCITYPRCEKPSLQSCCYCENFIPELYLLIHSKHEITRLIDSITFSKHTALIERDAEFLKIHLLLINEAISVYGKEYIETFLDLESIRNSVVSISNKLFEAGG